MVDATLQTILCALSSAPDSLGTGDDAPVMVVVLAREAQRFADTLGVRMVGLRAGAEAAPEVSVGFGDLVLDGQTREVHRGGRELNLTVTEFRLLEFLLRHPRQVLPRGYADGKSKPVTPVKPDRYVSNRIFNDVNQNVF